MMYPKSLQQRLALFILLPVCLLLVLMGVAGFVYTREKLISEWRVATILQLQLAAHRVDMLLAPVKHQITSINNDDGAEGIPKEVFDWSLARLAQQRGVERVILSWLHTPSIRQPENDSSRPERIDHITEPHFSNFVEDRSISLISQVMKDRTPVGQIEVVLSYEYLIQDMIHSGWWRSSKAFLVDDSGKILISANAADREWLGETGDPLEIKTRQAMQTSASGTLMDDDMPPDEVCGYFRLEEAPWAVVMIAPGRKILAPVTRFQYGYVSIAIVFVILILVLIRVVAGRSVATIRAVSRAAKTVAGGNYDCCMENGREDELGELVRSFNAMVSQLQERIRLKEAMDLAMEVQQSLLPGASLRLDGIEIAGRSLYCEETGGDYFDFLMSAETHGRKVSVIVGDVVGHGISAALLMTTVRALLRCRLSLPGGLAEVMGDVNRLLCEDTESSGSFMTILCVMFDMEKREAQWVRAGHDPGLLYDPSDGSFLELSGSGMALGIDKDCIYEANSRKNLRSGQLLLFGTDGIWEARNDHGEMFGKKRLMDLIRSNADAGVEDLVDIIIRNVREFQQSVRQEDDITLVAIRINDGLTEEEQVP
ncbi:PP2C family protein-serine/threonine phosphatase [Desulfatirhabdium butyrativorans]|uniref:PP2C family protein-serine/threonine phosphatase n=1 Tax=Desulfatirhabdium butyrativorans TaxID=340467 RepID=UPI00146FAEA2|nr:SpoIIE family protein phosphatase [Desulfatirhabdium butyrativorans]